MKTYLIEDSKKTMEYYIRGNALYDYLSKDGDAYGQNFKDRKFKKNKTNQDALNELKQIAKDYGNADEFDAGSIREFEADIENAINKANKDKNFEAVKEIKNLANTLSVVRELYKVCDAIDNAVIRLDKYAYDLGMVIQALKHDGITK